MLTQWQGGKTPAMILWRFSTAWYGTVRHGSIRYGTAQFGSVCISTAFEFPREAINLGRETRPFSNN